MTFRCGHPKTPANSDIYHADGYPRCRTCRGTRQRVPHPQPAYHGPCLEGCGRSGRRRSGYCRACWGIRAARCRRQQRTLLRVVGEAIPVAMVARLLAGEGEQKEARRMAAVVLQAVAEGQLMLRASQRPTWLWPGRALRVARLA